MNRLHDQFCRCQRCKPGFPGTMKVEDVTPTRGKSDLPGVAILAFFCILIAAVAMWGGQ